MPAPIHYRVLFWPVTGIYTLRCGHPFLNGLSLGRTQGEAKDAIDRINADRARLGLSLLADPEPEPSQTTSVGA